MSGANSRFDAPTSPSLASVRATAGVAVAFARADTGVTRLAHLEETGGFRAKFPRPEHGCEAVTINTGGGMLGGDRYRFAVSAGCGASATVSSQSAERIYRALDAATDVSVKLKVSSGATLHWVPQETIVFSGAKIRRRIEADVAADGTLLIVEAVVFGRAAHGETVRAGAFHDAWRIRRVGTLVFAEAVGLQDDMHATLATPAVADGAGYAASLLYLAPDASDRRDGARELLGRPDGRAQSRAAVSAWNGMLVGRFLAHDGASLRSDIAALTSYLMRRPMPRVWGV